MSSALTEDQYAESAESLANPLSDVSCRSRPRHSHRTQSLNGLGLFASPQTSFTTSSLCGSPNKSWERARTTDSSGIPPIPLRKFLASTDPIVAFDSWPHAEAEKPKTKVPQASSTYSPRSLLSKSFQKGESPASSIASPGSSTFLDEKADKISVTAVQLDPTTETVPPVTSWKSRLIQRLTEKFGPCCRPNDGFPSAEACSPTIVEKYSYIDLRRLPILFCGGLVLVASGIGAWLIIRADWRFFGLVVFAFFGELHTIALGLIVAMGRPFDLHAHNQTIKNHPLDIRNAPSVDVFLSISDESPGQLADAWRHTRQIRYPDDRLKVYVLDDYPQDSTKELCEQYGFSYVPPSRSPTQLPVASKTRRAFCGSNGEFFVLLSAGCYPRPDFLLEVMPVFQHDRKVAVVQTSMFNSSGQQTWVGQGAAVAREWFERLIQTCCGTWGSSITVGSSAIYRREAFEISECAGPVEDFEGCQAGLHAITRGWTVVFVPLLLTCSTSQSNVRSLFLEEAAACKDSLQMLSSPEFWRSKLALRQRLCYLSGAFHFIMGAVMVFLRPLPALILLWIQPELLLYYNFLFALPPILARLIITAFWSRNRHVLAAQCTQVIRSFAHVQAIIDVLRGPKKVEPMGWNGAGMNKNGYSNMRILAWIWTIALNSVLIVGAAYKVCKGTSWCHVLPALLPHLWDLAVAHRFLLD